MRDIESDSGLDDLFYYSVTWLERHGYIEIKAKELGSSCFDLVFPTEKTLAIMNAVPDALKGSRKSILEDIKDCLKMGTSQAIADAVKNIWNAGDRKTYRPIEIARARDLYMREGAYRAF